MFLLVAVAIWAVVLTVLWASSRRPRKAEKQASSAAVAQRVELNVVRKKRLGLGGARDFGGEVVLVEDRGFDLDTTIFRSVRSPLSRAVLKARLGLIPYWSDDACEAVVAAPLPRAPDHRQALLDFMNDECDFAMEHADGSFMHHLQFCYEYSAVHMPDRSPNVLLLHSVLGVGTNFFPCSVDKVSKLEALLTPTEFTHVQSFPSILRLILRRTFLDDLVSGKADGATGLAFHRVIDNAPITLDIDALWLQLNYQLIHLLDFLPLLDWVHALKTDVFLAPFAKLHNLLETKSRLMVKLEYNLMDAKPTQPGDIVASPSLGTLVKTYVPAKIQLAIGARQVAAFSKAIGHDLTYTFLYD